VTIRYLLDTNTVSYVISGNPRRVRVRLNSLTRSELALSAFTQAELLYGLARKPQATELRAEVEKFLQDFQILPWDSPAAAFYGDLRAAQERKGRRLSHEDLMIAAHALALGLTLVTHDQVFAFVDGLKTEDWTIA
jgi:tRNA(fMet)-specific endonuclease VapC